MKHLTSKFDVIITQHGESYTVSGKDVAALYHKLQATPPKAQTLEIGTMMDGTFTLRKLYLEVENVAKAANG